MNLSRSGVNYDFTTPTGGSAEISQYITNIIESNTGTQVDIEIKATEIIWGSGVPIEVKKYADVLKTNLVDKIVLVWANGVPTEVTRTNYDNGIIKTTNIEWVNGVPINVTKV